MTLREFIKTNRETLDAIIEKAIGGEIPKGQKNDEERKMWIYNDEGLYHWARMEGVRI